jgi:hypothetical protein
MRKKVTALVVLGALLVTAIPFQGVSAKSCKNAEILTVKVSPDAQIWKPVLLSPGRTISVTVKIKNTGCESATFWVGLSFKDGGGRVYDVKPKSLYLKKKILGGEKGKVTLTWEIPDGAYADPNHPLRMAVAVWEDYDGRYMQGLITRYQDTTWVTLGIIIM